MSSYHFPSFTAATITETPAAGWYMIEQDGLRPAFCRGTAITIVWTIGDPEPDGPRTMLLVEGYPCPVVHTPAELAQILG